MRRGYVGEVLCLLAVAAVGVSGCKQNRRAAREGSLSKRGASPTVKTAWKGETTLYDGGKHGFQIRYPTGWKKESWSRLGFHVVFVAPEKEAPGFRDNINVLSDNRPPVSLRQWLKVQDYTVRYGGMKLVQIWMNPVKLQGMDGTVREVVTKRRKITFRQLQYTFFTSTRVIQVTYSAEPSRFEAGLPRFRALMSTLRQR